MLKPDHQADQMQIMLHPGHIREILKAVVTQIQGAEDP